MTNQITPPTGQAPASEPVFSLRHTHSNPHGRVTTYPAMRIQPAKPSYQKTQPTSLKLTRSIRRQIYTADLVFSMSTCLAGSLPKKTKDVLARIQTRVDNINKILYGGGRFVLSPRDYKKYNQVVNQIKKIIMKISEDETLSPDFFNAVMLLVETAYESVQTSKQKRLRHEWAMLRQSMGTFCKHVLNEPDGTLGLEFPCDPKIYNYRKSDWPGYQYEPMGVALGEKFNKVMMG